MLRSLIIQNYALIDDIQVSLKEGLTVITGETGAGKSILLGALGLLMGQRADLSVSRDPSKKCVIEGSFDVANYKLQELFEGLDLDYEHPTIMRRELLPSGKSRAFVNDTPVGLQQMKKVAARLIHIHSQHQTLELTTERFQLELLDAVAGNQEPLANYKSAFRAYQKAVADLQALTERQQQSNRELDYHEFLYKELQEQDLASMDQEQMEADFNKLQHAERILDALGGASSIMENDPHGALSLLREARSRISGIADLGAAYTELFERLESSLIELDDLAAELGRQAEDLEADPQQLGKLESELNNLYRLQQKHQVDSVEALLAVQQDLWAKVAQATDADGQLAEMQEQMDRLKSECMDKAELLRQNRLAVIPELQKQLANLVAGLGMPQAQFSFVLEATTSLRNDGGDSLKLLFTANPGSPLAPISGQACGGELSRIMLAVKSILAKHQNLPTLVLDEIDTGVSGAVAAKMAQIMKEMATGMQLIAVTHLAQVAAQGQSHLKVFKEVKQGSTTTHINKLDHDQRILEIAHMIGGSSISDSALAHAKQLLN